MNAKLHSIKVTNLIDSPFNIGNNNFLNSDCFISSDDEYRHTKWMILWKKDLFLLRNYLREQIRLSSVLVTTNSVS